MYWYSINNATRYKAQSFKVITTFEITSIKIRGWQLGGGPASGTTTLGIKAVDGAGKPTGDYLTSNTKAASAFPTSDTGYTEITLPAYTLVAGTSYAVVLDCGSDLSGGNDALCLDVSNVNPYADGVLFSGLWTEETSYDLTVQLWGSLVLTPINVTDSGSGTEAAVSISSTFSATDTGAGAEGTPSIAFSLADVGSGSESALGLQSSILSTDAGLGSETSLTLTAVFSITDANNTSVDVVTIAGPNDKFVVDSAVGLDTAECEADIPVSDMGSCVESVEIAFTISDSGALVDAAALTASVVIVDSATGAETELTFTASVVIAETGSGADSFSIEASFTIAEVAAGSDISIVDVSFTINDLAAGAEATGLSVTTSISETGTGGEVIALTASFTIADVGAGADAQSLIVYITASELLSGVDLVTGISATFTITDAAAGVDAVTPVASVTVSDSGGLSSESWILVGWPLITETGVGFELVSKDFGILEEGLGAEFAWRSKGSILIDSFAPPHVLSIRIRDEADMDTRLIQGGSLPKQKMLGKPGRVVEIEGWTRDQDDIDDMEALMDGTARTFLHSSGDSFAVLVTDFDPESRVDEYDRRIYRLTLKETR